MTKRKRDESGALLGDLEQIRNLLEEEDAATSASPAPPSADSSIEPFDDEVPLLDDVVDGGMQVVEESLGAQPSLSRGTGSSALSQATFDALLGDAWKESTDDILSEARGRIRDESGWSPTDTNELNEALKVRIDAAIGAWLRELVDRNIDELRGVLADQLGAALADHLAKKKG
jgi:hypothetical protein